MPTEPEKRRIRRCDGGYEFHVSYHVDHDPETVWAMLTEPEKLAQWLAPGRIDPWPGGRARVDFEDSGIPIDSRVDAAEPARLLAYSWSSGEEPERPVRWEIAPDGTGARITLSLSLPQDEDAAKACAGWDAHLQMLLAALEGIPIRFPLDHFLAVRDDCRTAVSG